MTAIILTALLITSLIIIIIQGSKIHELKTFIKNIPPPPIPDMKIEDDPFGDDKKAKNRRGVIKGNWEETKKDGSKKHFNTYTEVEELENLGTLSRIKIINITGAPDYIVDYAKKQIPEIIEQDKIEFFP